MEIENNMIKNKLIELLNNPIINHKNEIIKKTTLKMAHIYCKYNNLSGQLSGILIEYYIQKKYNVIKNKPSSCIGDLYYNGNNYEIKTSNGGKYHKNFNYVQLRINHDCLYILTAYYININNINDLGELYIFRLTKKDLIYMILNYGSYAHGTIKNLGKIKIDELNKNSNNKEYALRSKYGDKCWKELLNFRIYESCI